MSVKDSLLQIIGVALILLVLWLLGEGYIQSFTIFLIENPLLTLVTILITLVAGSWVSSKLR